MNPVTRQLLERIADPDLADFAMGWDALEEQVVAIYRAGGCPPDAAAAYAALRKKLMRDHGRWAGALEPHWRAVLVDRAPLQSSPFERVLAVSEAAGVVDNWELMRTLPAAREALNNLLLERAVD